MSILDDSDIEDLRAWAWGEYDPANPGVFGLETYLRAGLALFDTSRNRCVTQWPDGIGVDAWEDDRDDNQAMEDALNAWLCGAGLRLSEEVDFLGPQHRDGRARVAYVWTVTAPALDAVRRASQARKKAEQTLEAAILEQRDAICAAAAERWKANQVATAAGMSLRTVHRVLAAQAGHEPDERGEAVA